MHMVSRCCYSPTRANSGRSNVAWVRCYSQCSGEGERSPIRLTERATSRWEMIDSIKCRTICQTMKIHNDATQIYHLKAQAVLYLVGVKWCWNTQTKKKNTQQHEQKVEIILVSFVKEPTAFFLSNFQVKFFLGVSGHVKMHCSPTLESHLPCHLNLVWSKVPYLNCDTSKAPLFYWSKTADLLGASLMFPLKLGVQMMNSKERVFTSTWRYWHGGETCRGSIIRLSWPDVKPEIKLKLTLSTFKHTINFVIDIFSDFLWSLTQCEKVVPSAMAIHFSPFDSLDRTNIYPIGSHGIL